MTQCIRHGEQTTRLHDPGVGAVPADADRRAARRPAGAELQDRRRSAHARAGDALPADAARLPAGARRVPQAHRRRDAAAHRADRRRRCRRDRVRRSRGRRDFGAGAGAEGRARRAGAPHGAGRADPEMGGPAQAGHARRGAAGRHQSRAGAAARHRPGAADGRHDDAAGELGQAQRPGAARDGQALGALVRRS